MGQPGPGGFVNPLTAVVGPAMVEGAGHLLQQEGIKRPGVPGNTAHQLVIWPRFLISRRCLVLEQCSGSLPDQKLKWKRIIP